jgi:polar amino acid transport system substrate-binding protein
MLADVSIGKIDIGASYIEWLPDREGNVLFSTPTDEGYCVMVVRSEDSDETGFFSWLKRGITNTLIVENRWQMIVEGMCVTLVITLFAALLGTLLGFVVYLLYREKCNVVNKFIDMSVTALQGVPDLILLMFFYYVVFGSINIGGTVVAVIVFAIILSVSVFIMLKSGSESIDKGQTEAALALGFTERRTYLKFILPQVVTVFFPTYKKALVDMMLSTAIVGYVAVQDLTRMGDLIRARTFDAFVPLIIVSIIYFLLSWLMLKGMGSLLPRLNPRNRKPEKILKGVNWER